MSENTYDFDIMNSIPCEFCNTLIDIQDYEEHARECRRNIEQHFNLYSIIPNFESLLEQISNGLGNTAEGDPDYAEPEEENIQPYNTYDSQQYHFYNDTNESNQEQINSESNDNDNLSGFSFMNELPNVLHSIIPNIQTFISNSIPVSINSNEASNAPPSISFEELLQSTHIGDQTAENYNEFMNLAQQIGKVKIGLSDEILENKFKISEKMDMCNICTVEKNIFMISPCNHELCKECTMLWYKDNKKCAHCQVEIE
jgi:hypothetical protein